MSGNLHSSPRTLDAYAHTHISSQSHRKLPEKKKEKMNIDWYCVIKPSTCEGGLRSNYNWNEGRGEREEREYVSVSMCV